MIQYSYSDDGMVPEALGEYCTVEDAQEEFDQYQAQIDDWSQMYERLEAQLEERQDRCDELEKAMQEIRVYANV